MEQETFTFTADLDLPPEYSEAIENQIVEQVKARFGDKYSGDDVETWNGKTVVTVTVNKHER